jgi:eukaryotic-like serine/threonine-protein kinase
MTAGANGRAFIGAGGSALKPGARVANKLELVRPLAEGGMGAVWIARNLTTGADVAVKVLRPDRKSDGSAERFRHEAKVGATLAHRNITRVFDLLEDDDGSLFLVMEVLRGETLRAYHKTKTTLSNTEAVAIIVPVLSALQHAHERKIVHRDLKPSNIFLHVDPDGLVTPKLIDFGIAKGAESTIETRTGDALGTPSYMSPEQVRAGELDGRSDLWALGVVLYELITGAAPFPGPTSTAVLAQVLELEVDPDPRIEPRLWLEIQRALGKQAYERHATAKEMAAALCAAIGETEASLAMSRSLQRDPADVVKIWSSPLQLVEADVPSERQPALGSSVPPRRVPSRYVLLAVAAVVLVGALAVIALRPSSDAAASKTRAAPNVAVAEPAPATPVTVTSAIASDPAPTASTNPAVGASTTAKRPARVQPARIQPAPAASAKSLARTPGF